ncbi:MAG: hypothetical protein HOV79_12350 [Hamadaea sp.]|nr:hypothetical protein [Hamadaea sp.]
MRWGWLVVGILMVLAGGVWTLQGVGVLGGSSMTGDTTWAIVGPIVAAAGLVGILIGVRKPHQRP